MSDNPQDVPQGPYIPLANMSNIDPMPDNSSLVSTSHSALTADLLVLAVANSKTAVRFWDAGTFMNGSPQTGDIIVFTDNTTVAGGGGNATFYVTSDHTSTGSALCSSILVNSLRGATVDSSANYNPGQPSVTSAKTITVPYTKQGNTGVVVLGISVLATITYPVTPNGTVITLFGIGISV